MGIYFLLPLMIATSCSVIIFFRDRRELPANISTRLVAPGLSAAALAVLFVLTSLNLKTFVGTEAMARVSMVAVVLVPLSGWLLARSYRKSRPAVYALIGNQ